MTKLKAAQLKAETAARKAQRLEDHARKLAEREMLKQSVANYKARKLMWSDRKAVEAQENRRVALNRLLNAMSAKAGGRQKLIEQIESAIERESERVALAQARLLANDYGITDLD
jgi:HD superfamily phosphodiesterase